MPAYQRLDHHIDPDEFPPSQPDNDQGIEQIKSNALHHKQVHGSDLRRMVVQEGEPLDPPRVC